MAATIKLLVLVSFAAATLAAPPDCSVATADRFHLPHESDCTKFYKCSNGVPYLFDCPSPLYFNNAIQVCDWPANTNCSAGSSPPTPSPSPAPTPSSICADATLDDFHVPHPTDCTKFYKCDWGKPVLFDCPSGLHFNPVLDVCDWPDKAGCASSSPSPPTPSPSPSPSPSPTPSPTPSSICADATLDDFHVPHPTDCTKFYKCDWGKPVLFDCPSGLHFNPVLDVCDWPDKAGCASSSPSPPTPSPSPSPSPSPTPSPTPSSICADATLDDFHVPHPTDCNKFYKCDWGKPVLFDCPSGLHFNPVLDVCDWPDKAGCASSSPSPPTPSPSPSPSPSPTPSPTPSSICADATLDDFHVPHPTDCTKFYKCDWGKPVLFDCPSGLHFNPVLDVCDWPDKAGCASSSPSPPTPSPSPSPSPSPTPSPTPSSICADATLDDFHVPHPTDCTKFYKCDWGKAVLFDCPSGLHFNPVLDVCDWPDKAGCASSSPSPPTPSPSPSPSPSPTPSPTPSSICADATLDDFHVPHPTDCTKFYKCDWGKPVLFDCPSGLHFNPVLDVCDWPDKAGCASSSPSPPTPSPSPSPSPSPTPSPTPSSICADATLDDFHVPHPTDCTKFYKCDWGKAVLFDCPSGLHFNPVLDVCDWPDKAGCASSSPSPPTPTPSPSPGPSSICVDATLVDFHVPHPTDCTKFYKCDWGKAVLFDCPSGLNFNPVLDVCDWPKDAGCSV